MQLSTASRTLLEPNLSRVPAAPPRLQMLPSESLPASLFDACDSVSELSDHPAENRAQTEQHARQLKRPDTVVLCQLQRSWPSSEAAQLQILVQEAAWTQR